jgi:hypothetical protein
MHLVGLRVAAAASPDVAAAMSVGPPPRAGSEALFFAVPPWTGGSSDPSSARLVTRNGPGRSFLLDAAPGRRARRADPAAGRQPGHCLGAGLPWPRPAGRTSTVASFSSAWPGAASAHLQIADLVRVGVAVGDGSSEDRRVGCDPRCATVTGELGTAPGQPFPAQVIQPDRHPGWRANLSSGRPSSLWPAFSGPAVDWAWPVRWLVGPAHRRADVSCVRPAAAVDVPGGAGDAAG